ncbi:MAG TPA: carboxypeptidase-like regulatory domain-containing protein [Bryobacteraceae bacterium]|nr:carboxypeptidase-like regulatory domain-containing protein [Bryobacteraceae bacterium]
MRRWFLLALATGTLEAAVIRGSVVENQTGKPLARALVIVRPVAGTAGSPHSVRTNAYGAFEFPQVAPGVYLVSAQKRAFAPAQYGQKHYKAAGFPIVLDETAAPFLNLRLQRYGAITGTVVDENDVGLPDHDVAAFRNTRPPELAGRARTDDRGVYRIGGLEPGSYIIRTVGKQYDDGGYLPTFAKETARLEEARPFDVNLDQQVEEAGVRPFPGQLFVVGGQTLPGVQANITLISEMGSEQTTSDASGNFKFPPQAPGNYELYARSVSSDRRGGGVIAGYRQLLVDRERTDNRINLGIPPDVRLVVEDTKGQAIDPAKVQLLIRRKDLSGEGSAEDLRVLQGAVRIMPGRWELSMAPSASYYVAGFSGPRNDSMERVRPDGWNEIMLLGPGQELVKFVLSSTPARIHGTVSNTNHDPVAGVPVFLEAYDPATRRRLTDLRVTQTDIRGQYQFFGLAPGNYRILSSFEFQTPETAALDAANAHSVQTEEGRDLPVDLDLYVIH